MSEKSVSNKGIIVSLIVVFLIMATFGYIASENPDGLERSLEEIEQGSEESGFLEIDLGNDLLSSIVQMLTGMIIVGLLVFGLSWLLKKRTAQDQTD
ncbi:MAG: PDGLE domain-containing protein [Candidatus Kariarchaeaceae archaeon]